jgi:hypothetical protein
MQHWTHWVTVRHTDTFFFRAVDTLTPEYELQKNKCSASTTSPQEKNQNTEYTECKQSILVSRVVQKGENIS